MRQATKAVFAAALAALTLASCGNSVSQADYEELLQSRGLDNKHMFVEIDGGLRAMYYVRQNCTLRLDWNGGDDIIVNVAITGNRAYEGGGNDFVVIDETLPNPMEPGTLGAYCDRES